MSTSADWTLVCPLRDDDVHTIYEPKVQCGPFAGHSEPLADPLLTGHLSSTLDANVRTINFLASGGAVNKYANYAKISYHNPFKTGPSISYVPLFRGGWGLKMRTIDDMMPILSICHG